MKSTPTPTPTGTSPGQEQATARLVVPDGVRAIVVLGGGYAGLAAARAVASKLRRDPTYQVVLVDRAAIHELKPKLPEAVGAWTDCQAAVPLRPLLEDQNVTFLQAAVTGVDAVRREVLTDAGAVPYWRLVVALGGEPDLAPDGAPIPGLSATALTPYSRGAACHLRHHLGELARTAASLPPEARQQTLTVVVAGGGFVGVEMAGEIADRLADLTREAGLAPDVARVVLVEPKRQLLGFEPRLGEAARRSLLGRGVELRFGVAVVEARPDGVRLSDGTDIRAETLVWTGGVRANSIAATLGVPTDERGRLHVDASLRVVGPPGIYALGDDARVAPLDDWPDLAGSAQAAVAQGRTVAEAIVAEAEGKRLPTYRPRSRGVVIQLGHREAVARVGGWYPPGWMARWLKQLPVMEHLYRIGGVRLLASFWGATVLPVLAPSRVSRYALAGDGPSPAA